MYILDYYLFVSIVFILYIEIARSLKSPMTFILFLSPLAIRVGGCCGSKDISNVELNDQQRYEPNGVKGGTNMTNLFNKFLPTLV